MGLSQSLCFLLWPGSSLPSGSAIRLPPRGPSPLLTRAAALSPTSGPYPPVRPHQRLTPYLSSWSLHVFVLLQLSHFSRV